MLNASDISVSEGMGETRALNFCRKEHKLAKSFWEDKMTESIKK